jgi:hypothetical protein
MVFNATFNNISVLLVEKTTDLKTKAGCHINQQELISLQIKIKEMLMNFT